MSKSTSPSKRYTRDAKYAHSRDARKLTPAQVLDIFHSRLSCRTLSRTYGVSPMTVSKVKRGLHYADITGQGGVAPPVH